MVQVLTVRQIDLPNQAPAAVHIADADRDRLPVRQVAREPPDPLAGRLAWLNSRV